MLKPFRLIRTDIRFISSESFLYFTHHQSNKSFGSKLFGVIKGKIPFLPVLCSVTKAYTEATNLSRNVKPSVESRKQF